MKSHGRAERKATAGAQSHRGMLADWWRPGIVGVAAAAGRAGWTPPVGGRTSAARASRARARVILRNGGGPGRRRQRRALWRAAEIRWVGGGLAGRELEDAPGGAQCCFSCVGARVTTDGRRCGGGGRAARFWSPLRIEVGCTSLAARLKSGPNPRVCWRGGLQASSYFL
jgi:hypothetical protein